MGPRHPADNAIYYGNTGINNLRAQLGGCIELSTHKTSVKCGHINTDTDQTTSGGMLNVDSNFGLYWHVDSNFRHVECKWRHVDSKFRYVECKFRHVAVLTRPQTLSLIILQIAPRAGDGNILR